MKYANLSNETIEMIEKHTRELPKRQGSMNKWSRKSLYKKYFSGFCNEKELYLKMTNNLEGFSAEDISYGVEKIYFEVLDKICGHDMRIRGLNKGECWYLATTTIMNELRSVVYKETGVDYCSDNDYTVVFYDCESLEHHIFVFNNIMSVVHKSIHTA